MARVDHTDGVRAIDTEQGIVRAIDTEQGILRPAATLLSAATRTRRKQEIERSTEAVSRVCGGGAKRGLSNETYGVFTNVEGDGDDVMALVKTCVMTVAEAALRVSVVIKIDHRPGVSDALRGKVDAIEQRLAPRGP
jgi:uncharacterized protein YqgV (UPF0045/DUF77 family)